MSPFSKPPGPPSPNPRQTREQYRARRWRDAARERHGRSVVAVSRRRDRGRAHPLSRRVKGLKVSARTSSFAYRARDVDVREIARDLGVATVLEGNLRRAGDTVRVIVRLVDAHTGFHIWSQSYDRRVDDLLGLRGELASEVVQSLSPSRQAGAIGFGFGPMRPTASPKAYRLFLE